MSFTVSKTTPTLITPSSPTPSGYLPLSYFDRLPVLNFFVETLFVFRHGVNPATAIKDAVAKVLVPYYPLAGRLTDETDDGKLQVACNAKGMWFVEAKAEFGLEDVGFLDRQPLKMDKDELLPELEDGVVDKGVPFMIQVTEFKCGGFTLGFKSSHVMFDGIGAAQFKIALGELARGLAHPSTTPIWCRDAIPSPPDLENETQLTHAAASTPKFVHFTTDIKLANITQIQSHLSEKTGQRFSVFDIMTAKLWQIRTRAIKPEENSFVTLSFPANIRGELRNELPSGGYYGNCTMPFVVKASSEKIMKGTVVEIMEMITEAKRSLPSKVARFLKGEKEDDKEDLSVLTYATTNLTDMRRVGLTEADYGWGPPTVVLPLVGGPVNLVLIMNSPLGKEYVRLLTHCVAEEHLQGFKDELKALE